MKQGLWQQSLSTPVGMKTHYNPMATVWAGVSALAGIEIDNFGLL
jgi:hypothetical protein